jgi:glycosyltransferase involved in cell wall biosynthesis
MKLRQVTLVLNCLRSGGAEKQLLWIAGEVASAGMTCNIIELVAGERTERIEAMVRIAVAKGVKVFRAPSDSGSIHGLWRLWMCLGEAPPDLLWSWGLRADFSCLLTRIGRRSGKWLISIRCATRRTGLLGMWPQFIFAKYSDGVVSNTRAGFVTSGVQKIQGLRMWVLPNAARDEPAEPVSLPDVIHERLVLIMLGNIKIQHKGYDLAARLARALRDAGFDFELRIAGRPDELPKLEEIFRQLDVQSVIKFYGEVSRPEEFLREGHLYLLLSRFEGMPNTLLEALSVGLPAIATEVGDLKTLKERGAPFVLIPVEDIQAATTAVRSAVRNWPETKRAGLRGREWIQENFSEAACRSTLKNLLVEVMAR